MWVKSFGFWKKVLLIVQVLVRWFLKKFLFMYIFRDLKCWLKIWCFVKSSVYRFESLITLLRDNSSLRIGDWQMFFNGRIIFTLNALSSIGKLLHLFRNTLKLLGVTRFCMVNCRIRKKRLCLNLYFYIFVRWDCYSKEFMDRFEFKIRHL